MKKILVLVIVLKLLLIFPAASYADSPITATKFYEAYLDVKMVERAHLEGVMGLEIAEFLTSQENPIDVKAAVINALHGGLRERIMQSCMHIIWHYCTTCQL